MSKSRLGIKIIGTAFAVFKKHCLAFWAGFAFAIVCFVVLEAMMKPVSTPGYCGTKCHEMNTAYQTWELSVHGANKFGIQVGCVECHLPAKDKFFTHIAAKAYEGGKDTYMHYFGSDYDVEKTRKKILNHMPNERCRNCHDDLLVRPGTSAARIAHTEVLAQSEAPQYKCVKCHEDAGHQRKTKLFSP